MVEGKKPAKVRARRTSTEDRHYIDDKQFYAALCEYRLRVLDAEAAQLPKPMVPDYIAHNLMILARKIARKPGFSRYPFVEDMIGDAILCCFRNIHNFNPQHASAFPYFTTIVHQSFVQRIEKEKKILYRTFKAIMERQKELAGIVEASSAQVYGSRYSDEKMREFCDKFESRLMEKRQKSRERKKNAATAIQFDSEDTEE